MERKKFTKQLTELVAIPTLSENAIENSKALDLIETWIKNKNILKNKIRKTNGNAEILLLGNGDNILKPTIGYLAHVDVVPADTNLFKMRQENDNLFGRGVYDMKFSIPLGIDLLNTISEINKNVDLTVAITTDEEVGGMDGAQHLAEEMKFKPRILIVPDGGENFVFINKSKGVAHVSIESRGISTHASTPWLGKNALTPLILLSDKLLLKYDSNSKTENWETTMNLGLIKGGESVNQVCDSALLKIDFRFPETRSVDEIVEEVSTMAKNIDPSVKVNLTASGDPTYTDPNIPAISTFIQILSNKLQREIKIEGDPGASDARYWAKYSIPIIMTAPNGGGIHGDDEWIDLNSCMDFYEILYDYINTITHYY